MRVSLDRASMNLASSSSSSSATLSRDADQTTLRAESLGLTVDTAGMTSEETSSIMERLSTALKDGTLEDKLEGATRLTAADFKDDGSEGWTLDFSGVVDKLFGKDDQTATNSPAAATSGGVSLLV